MIRKPERHNDLLPEKAVRKKTAEDSRDQSITATTNAENDHFAYSITEGEMKQIRKLEKTAPIVADLMWYKIKTHHLEALLRQGKEPDPILDAQKGASKKSSNQDAKISSSVEKSNRSPEEKTY